MTQDPLLEFVRQRIEDMLVHPGMWGSLEAVELQTITLLEVKECILRPGSSPRSVLDRYCGLLAQRYKRGNFPLHVLEPQQDTFLEVLREIVGEMNGS